MGSVGIIGGGFNCRPSTAFGLSGTRVREPSVHLTTRTWGNDNRPSAIGILLLNLAKTGRRVSGAKGVRERTRRPNEPVFRCASKQARPPSTSAQIGFGFETVRLALRYR